MNLVAAVIGTAAMAVLLGGLAVLVFGALAQETKPMEVER